MEANRNGNVQVVIKNVESKESKSNWVQKSMRNRQGILRHGSCSMIVEMSLFLRVKFV